MTEIIDFKDVARLPQPGDNVAIATRFLQAGTCIRTRGSVLRLDSDMLEGHRFAVAPISGGEFLLSWNLPFGVALRDISPGTYVCNAGMLEALRLRNLEFQLPAVPNFEDRIEPYMLEKDAFHAGDQVQPTDDLRTFEGYVRGAARGVGTRNYILIMGTTSRTGAFVKRLEERLGGLADAFPDVDGIVAVSHTEGGGRTRPNNLELLLRTLAGFMVHPNIGAALAVDYGTEPLTNAMLRAYMDRNNAPLSDVPHCFLTLRGGFDENLDRARDVVTGWLEGVNRTTRRPTPVAGLKIALQCGGSDAFSGVSGNPLASWVAREIIRHGGAANLAETDELIGAEPYVLQNVRDLDTARRFLDRVEAYKELAARHGTSAEGNPSGGNKFRGIYNIVLKSIGAAMKRHPEVRLDGVLDYSAPMREPGFYFMDSPGNDLESIAGQVASGCNLIYFITGNGSITNFPFVPTLKIITTTGRYELLANEMDVNAGAYLDGTPMDALGAQMTGLTLDVASGERSKGECAGHAQVSIWRNWRQTDSTSLELLRSGAQPSGKPVAIDTEHVALSGSFHGIATAAGTATDQIGLILPTSLCAGQVARMAAAELDRKRVGKDRGITRYVALVHTEGCGVAGDLTEKMYSRTMLGYLTHPLVKHALLLEHGCEKTHNDYLRHELERGGIDPDRFGWSSIQLDGGLECALRNVESWFAKQAAGSRPPVYEQSGPAALSVGILSDGEVNAAAAASMAILACRLVRAGATVVTPDNSALLDAAPFTDMIPGNTVRRPSLGYGQAAVEPGFFIMETQTDHWVETLTGLGGTGVEILIAHVSEHPVQGHPMLPLLQTCAEPSMQPLHAGDLDLLLSDNPEQNVERIAGLLMETASRNYTPVAMRQKNTDFQFTRGLLGVSM
jgi:altronate dehydratase